MKNELHRARVATGIGRRFHFAMLTGFTLLLLIVFVCSIKAPVADWPDKIAVASVIVIVSAIPALLWHDRKEYVRRDAALALPWTCVLLILLPIVAVLSARLQFPLRDALFAKVDLAMGFKDPAIVAWTAKHWPVSDILDRSYSLLVPLLAGAALLPALLGKREAAERFVLANTIAFLVSFPLFTFLPAVGPWYGYHFPGDEPQVVAETAILALHAGTATTPLAGVLTFPSFHVIWAVLSGWALWSIKPLRILAIAVATLVAVSTVTTGWHYAADVVFGAIIAVLSWFLAGLILRRDN